jgi:hypothetical protein
LRKKPSASNPGPKGTKQNKPNLAWTTQVSRAFLFQRKAVFAVSLSGGIEVALFEKVPLLVASQ